MNHKHTKSGCWGLETKEHLTELVIQVCIWCLRLKKRENSYSTQETEDTDIVFSIGNVMFLLNVLTVNAEFQDFSAGRPSSKARA